MAFESAPAHAYDSRIYSSTSERHRELLQSVSAETPPPIETPTRQRMPGATRPPGLLYQYGGNFSLAGDGRHNSDPLQFSPLVPRFSGSGRARGAASPRRDQEESTSRGPSTVERLPALKNPAPKDQHKAVKAFHAQLQRQYAILQEVRSEAAASISESVSLPAL